MKIGILLQTGFEAGDTLRMAQNLGIAADDADIQFPDDIKCIKPAAVCPHW